MRRATIYGREVEMQGSPYTFYVYRKAFEGDLLKAIITAYQESPIDVSLLLQVVWAMAKTHDDETPEYIDWLREFDPEEFAVNELDWVGEVDGAISAELFRNEKTGRAYRFIRRIRRAVARRMGALAKRLGA